MRRAFLTALMLAALALPASAQSRDETLADIRQELSVLFVTVQQLKRELSTTGGVSTAVGGDTLRRVELIEAELARLTAKSEELEFRINQVVLDGTNRIGDLEFRLCELETGCDIAKLGTASTLGGGAAPVGPRATPASTGGELAIGEQGDFDRAAAALDGGDFAEAARLFQAFTDTYSGGPLSAEAHFLRGEALAGLGETSSAARAYLTSFSGDPRGSRAPDALLRLGQSLGDLGQLPEACVTLGEVGARFPGTPQMTEAEAARRALGCS